VKQEILDLPVDSQIWLLEGILPVTSVLLLCP